MNTMNSRERILAALRREPVDYVPCSPFFNPQDYVQRIGHRYNFPFGPSRDEIVTWCVEQYGLDMVVSVPWRSFYPEQGVSSSMTFDGAILTKTWKTPSGEISASIRYDDEWPHGYDVPFYTDYTIGRFEKPWIENEADLKCFAHILKPPSTKNQIDELRFGWMAAKRLADRFQLATIASIGMGLTGMQHLCDSAALCLLVVDDPGLVEAYLDLEHRVNLANCDIVLEFGVDIIRRNGFYESTDFYSPTMIEGFLKERINEEAAAVHKAGAVIGYTLLTGYTPMVDYLSRLDLDAIMTPDPFFEGADPVALNAACGDKMCFWTGPSDTIHMPWDDQRAIDEAVSRVFEIYGKTGLIVAPCSSAKAAHPWANTVAMVDAWKRLR